MDYEALVKAVKKHGNLEDTDLIDAANHGADSGFSEFCYYDDTVAFYDSHEKLIWDLLAENAESMGVKPLELVAGFGCADSIADMQTFKNALAWFALEEAGRYLQNKKEVARA